MYLSAIQTGNEITTTNLFLDNMNYYDRQIFPTYPNPLVNCASSARICIPPASVVSHLTQDVSAFAANFQTPRVEQASVNLEKEFARRTAAGVSYMYVHGEDLIRARDVNLPLPTSV